MIVNPRVYYKEIGSIKADRNKDVVFNAVKAIVTSGQLQHWQDDGTDDQQIVVKNVKLKPGMLFKFYRDPILNNCLGQLLTSDGNDWSPPCSMVGGRRDGSYTFHFDAHLVIGNRIYVVEVEDAIFVYAMCTLIGGVVGGSTALIPNNFCYAMAAGNIIQPFDVPPPYFKGDAIMGGVPLLQTNANNNSTSVVPYYVMPATWHTPYHDNTKNFFSNNWAFYNDSWIRVAAPHKSASGMWTYASGMYSNNRSGAQTWIERAHGLFLQALEPDVNGNHVLTGLLGFKKYARRIGLSNLYNPSLGGGPMGWRKNQLLTSMYPFHGLIWCANESDEIKIP